MTCPACHSYGHAGYDARWRPIPCRKCKATGRIGDGAQTQTTGGGTVDYREYIRTRALIP